VQKRVAGASGSALAKVCGAPRGAVTERPGVATQLSEPVVNRTAPASTNHVSSVAAWTCCGGPIQPGESSQATSPIRPVVAAPSSRTVKVLPAALKVSAGAGLG